MRYHSCGMSEVCELLLCCDDRRTATKYCCSAPPRAARCKPARGWAGVDRMAHMGRYQWGNADDEELKQHSLARASSAKKSSPRCPLTPSALREKELEVK